MPLYEYECESCAHRFEVIQKFSDPPVETCPKCGAPVRKLVASPAFQFKGSGWYVTDYGKKDSGGEKKSGAAADPKADAATSVPAGTDSKPAAASDSGSKPATPAAPAKSD